MVKQRTFLCMFVWLLCLMPAAAFAARVQVVADRDRMNAGQSLHLELRIEGDPDSDPDLSALERDWEVLGRSQSTQLQIVNGDFNRSLVYSLTLMPRREGEVPIPSICVGSDCSMPLPITVMAAGAPSAAGKNAPVMLEAEVDAKQVISQGQLLYKVRLLHRGDLLQGSLSEPQPAGVEAVVQKLGEDRKYQTRRGGRLYQVIERDYAIFPQAGGTLRIPPLQFDGAVAGNPSRLDPFGRRGERLRLSSDAVQVEVMPPPADPAGRTWLPARSLRLNDDWQGKTVQLTVGEPATRTLTVAVEGQQAAQLPELQVKAPDGFKTYPDQPDRQDHPSEEGITGVLQQKIALVPTRPGRYRLPAMALDWWDVTSGQWRQARFAPVDIEVGPEAGAAVGASPSAASPPPAPKPSGKEAAAEPSTVPVSPAASALPGDARQGVTAGFWPWLSLALGLGWLTTLLWLWRQRSGQSRRPAEPAESTLPVREKTARRAVEQAAAKNDPQATRRALAAWSATLPHLSGRPDLDAFMRTAPAPLRDAMDELNRALYAPGGQGWSGATLLEAIRQWRPQGDDAAGADALPELYPG